MAVLCLYNPFTTYLILYMSVALKRHLRRRQFSGSYIFTLHDRRTTSAPKLSRTHFCKRNSILASRLEICTV